MLSFPPGRLKDRFEGNSHADLRHIRARCAGATLETKQLHLVFNAGPNAEDYLRSLSRKRFHMNTTSLRCVLLALGMATFPSFAQNYIGEIIDGHAHVRLSENDGLRPDQPVGIADLRRLDTAAGIARSALIVMNWSGDMVATRAKNNGVIAAAAADPTHFYPVASVHPADGDQALAELERLAKLGVKQIKLHPNSQEFDVADPAVARVTARCGELGLAVLFDSYNPLDPGQLGKLLALSMKQPGTKFVLAHMGYSQFRETATYALLKKMGMPGNVWFDLSAIVVFYAGSPVQDELVWTMRQIGMDKIVFGSDWPIEAPANAVAAVRTLQLTPEEQKLVLHDNIAGLLQLH
jgi:uncharacterized protein